MKKLNKRERILLSVFLAVLLISFGVQFVLFPSLDKIKELINERAELQMKWNTIESLEGTEESLKMQTDKLKTENQEIGQQLPAAQASHLYWEFINKSVEQTGVELVQLQEEEPNYEENSRLIHLQLTGSVSQILSFIETMENMPYINAITEASIQETNQLVTAVLTINTSARQK